MTNKRVIQFGLTDLVSVQLSCDACHISLEYPIDSFGTTSEVLPNLPARCPQCSEVWGLDQDLSTVHRVLFALAKHRQAVDTGRGTVTLEFSLPDNGPPDTRS